MKKYNKTPKLRFSGYTDDWEQRKLLSCIQSITDFRGRTPKKLGMDWSESGYLALSALNVKDGYIDFSQDVHYGNQELYDKWMSGKELHRGQVLFTTEAPMGNVAQVPDNKGYILSQRTIAFDVEEKILSENFLATLLRTPNVFNDLIALSSGGTAKGVSQKSLSGLDVVIPKNIDEQNKLADYFINLDNLITLHQRKLEKLQNMKKSCLQKMFPRDGATVPEIRFSEFQGDWEERTLGSCFEERLESLPDGELLSVTIGSGIKKFSELDRHDNSNTDKSKYKRVCIGDIAYNSMRMWQGASGRSPYEGIVSPAYTVVKPIGDIDTQFFAYMFKKKEIIHLFEINSQGLTSDTWNLKYPAFSKIVVRVPRNVEEQSRIARFLLELDELISCTEQEIEITKRMKKGCLQKMFA